MSTPGRPPEHNVYAPPNPEAQHAAGYPPAQSYAAPAPGFGYPPPQGYAGAGYQVPPSRPAGSSPSDTLHWMVPVGRSWQSILAGYLGLLSPVVVLLAPFAIGFGIWALQRARSGGHGTGRAITGIVGGVVGMAVGALVLVMSVG